MYGLYELIDYLKNYGYIKYVKWLRETEYITTAQDGQVIFYGVYILSKLTILFSSIDQSIVHSKILHGSYFGAFVTCVWNQAIYTRDLMTNPFLFFYLLAWLNQGIWEDRSTCYIRGKCMVLVYQPTKYRSNNPTFQ